jgi:hypothetical protein
MEKGRRGDTVTRLPRISEYDDDNAGGHVGPPLHCAFDDHDAGDG